MGWADNKILEQAGIPTYAGRYSNLFRLMNDGDKLDFFPAAWWRSSPSAASWWRNIPTWSSISTC